MFVLTYHKLKTDKEKKNTPNWSHTARVVWQLSGLDPGVSEGEEGRERNDRDEGHPVKKRKSKKSEKKATVRHYINLKVD